MVPTMVNLSELLTEGAPTPNFTSSNNQRYDRRTTPVNMIICTANRTSSNAEAAAGDRADAGSNAGTIRGSPVWKHHVTGLWKWYRDSAASPAAADSSEESHTSDAS